MDRGGGLGCTFRIFAAHVQTRTQFAAPRSVFSEGV